MAQTFTDAVSAITTPCESTLTRLKKIKALLDATEEALFNNAAGGAIKTYRVNTGQTVIDVEVGDINSLMRQYKELSALYNELCGIYSGGNVMAFRDASTGMR